MSSSLSRTFAFDPCRCSSRPAPYRARWALLKPQRKSCSAIGRPACAQLIAHLLEGVVGEGLGCGRRQRSAEIAFRVPPAGELLDDQRRFATVFFESRAKLDLAVNRGNRISGADVVRQLTADVVFQRFLREPCEEVACQGGRNDPL